MTSIRTAAWAAIYQALAFSPQGHLVRFLQEDEAERIAGSGGELVDQLREQIKLLESQLEQIEAGGDLVEELARVKYELQAKSITLAAAEESIKRLESQQTPGALGDLDDKILRHKIAILVTDGYDDFTEDPVPEWPRIQEDVKSCMEVLRGELNTRNTQIAELAAHRLSLQKDVESLQDDKHVLRQTYAKDCAEITRMLLGGGILTAEQASAIDSMPRLMDEAEQCNDPLRVRELIATAFSIGAHAVAVCAIAEDPVLGRSLATEAGSAAVQVRTLAAHDEETPALPFLMGATA